MDRRTLLEDRQADLEGTTFNLVPERWTQLYQDRAVAAIVGEPDEDSPAGETPVDDIDALDRWYEEMVASGGKQFIDGNGHPMGATERWGEWQ